MRVMTIAGIITMLGAGAASAALPPQYQRQAELAAIIADASIADAFGFGGVEGVEFVAPDLYRVRGGACTLEVRIEDDPAHKPAAGWVGPRQFIVVPAAEPVCK